MEPTNTMTELLAAATSLFTWCMTNIATLITTITSNPILLLSFLMVLCGFVFGLLRRLININ